MDLSMFSGLLGGVVEKAKASLLKQIDEGLIEKLFEDIKGTVIEAIKKALKEALA